MRNPVNIDEFENYLEQEVNQHRMYPSDYVWRNIQQELHGYKKWPALTVITLFVISALVTGTLLLKPHQQAIAYAKSSTAKATDENTEKGSVPKENLQQHLSPEHITQQTIAAANGDIDIDGAMQNAFAAYHGIAELQPATSITDYAAGASFANVNALIVSSQGSDNENINKANVAVAASPATNIKKPGYRGTDKGLTKNNSPVNWMKMPFYGQAPDRFYYSKGIWKTEYSNILFSSVENLPSSSSADFTAIMLGTNLTKQSSRSIFKAQPKADRFDIQGYITPSISYRTLTLSKSGASAYLSGNGAYMVNGNQLVRNGPAAGYEAGAAIGYKLSSTLTLRTGLQFNLREYDIEGANFGAAPDVSPASSNSTGMPGGVNVSAQSAQSAQGGKQQETVVLTNRYYQIALPVGIDWRAWGSGKLSWGLAASMQPTYIVNKDPFIVASSNNSYADGSKLMRNWNINSSLETYFAYTMGKFKWQIGPQVRYQMLSTLKSSYPVTEHLLDLGIKIGVVRSLP